MVDSNIEEVLEHYTGGIKATATLDPKFKDEMEELGPIPLTPLEKKAVIAFLGTLSGWCVYERPQITASI